MAVLALLLMAKLAKLFITVVMSVYEMSFYVLAVRWLF